MSVRVTYYLDVLSQWCWLAERALDQVRAEFGERVSVDWRLACVNGGAPIGASKSQYVWYYGRTKAVSGTVFNPDWMEGPQTGTLAANLAVETARILGASDDRIRRAIARAALFDGKPMGRLDVAEAVASAAADIPVPRFREIMNDPATHRRLDESAAAFAALGVDQRPTFVVENTIGDRAIISGLYAYEPLRASVSAMLHDATIYAEYSTSHPQPA